MHRLAAAAVTFSVFLAPALASTTHSHAKHSTALVASGQTCQSPDDRTAFDTEGLKSELMVTAEACKMTDKFNTFINTYKPEVRSQELVLEAYFKKHYGRAGQKAYDDYITNLANVQEQDGLKTGTAFCQIFQNMFDEVMSLHNGSELADYAHSQAIVQPLAFTTCSDVPVKLLSKPRHKVTKHKSA
jgi:hypothetical protein